MIRIIAVSKTSEKYLQKGIDEYLKRLKRFHKLEYIELPALKNTKNLSEVEQKRKEGALIIAEIKTDDYLILLDEGGTEFTSEELAVKLEKKLTSFKNVVLVIGGAYGFSPQLYQRANEKWALSRLTFNHQMVRLFLVEQLYRAFSIWKGLPYHHR